MIARFVAAVALCASLAACAGKGLQTNGGAMLPDASNGAALVSPRYHFVTCRGVDDYATIQAKLAQGGTTKISGKTCAIGQTLKITQSDTFLRGTPGSNAREAFVAETTLTWTGSRNGTVLLIGGTSQEIQGGGISNIGFDSNHGSAAIGLDLEGVEGAIFTNVAADSFNVAAIALGQRPNGLNTMNNLFTNYVLTNTHNSGAGVLIDTPCGSRESEQWEKACWSQRNLSYYNQFVNGHLTVSTGIGIETLTSDGNLFQGLRIAEVAPVNGTWQGVGVFFGCFSVSNHVQGLSFSSTGPIANPSWNIVALGSYPARAATKNLLDVCKYDPTSPTPYTTASFSDSVQGYEENGNVAAAPLSGTVRGANVVCVNSKCTNYGEGDHFWCTTVSKRPCRFQAATNPRARRFSN